MPPPAGRGGCQEFHSHAVSLPNAGPQHFERHRYCRDLASVFVYCLLVALRFAVGAELSTARGSAEADDHNGVVHAIWTFAFNDKVQLWPERVPSEQNTSDTPSRGDRKLLKELGAQWRQQVWDLT